MTTVPRITERISELGFASATEFANERPQAPFGELGKELGVAGIQVMRALYEEAVAGAEVNRFACDALVRTLCELLPDGWGRGPDPDMQRAGVYGMWSSIFGPVQREQVDRVWSHIKESAAPGWRPTGVTDPLLREAFAGVEFELLR